MPKFMTYQRPIPVNKQRWGGKPGHAYGPAPKPAKLARTEQPPAQPRLPTLPNQH